MKKTLLILMSLVSLVGNAAAQVYLSKTLKPVEERKYSAHYPGVRGSEASMYMAAYEYQNGFTLFNGITNDDAKNHAYAVFSLKGGYDKISFVYGPFRGGQGYNKNRWSAQDSDADIILVKADGRKLLDEVVRVWEAPREVVLDISGVDELRFEDWSGLCGVNFAEVKLWKKGQTPTLAKNPQATIAAKQKVKLVEELKPHLIDHRGWSIPITKDDWPGIGEWEYMHINTVKYESGIAFGASQELGEGISKGFAYFWLQKAFDKISFVIGPWDQKSSNAQAWFTVKGDGKIIYEKLVKQTDLAEVVVLDVSGINVLSMHSGELEKIDDMLGGMKFGVVDIYAYKNGCPDIPVQGFAEASKDKISKLPDVTKLCSNIKPFSTRGIVGSDKTFFDGSSSHYTFSMGGEKFDEGFILATGTTLFFEDNIGAYYRFDLAGEYDWVSFTAGTLTKHRVLDDDIIRVYADDKVILETKIHSTWPNQRFTLPINKCRTLTFSKPGTGKSEQTYFGFGDITLYRGNPVENSLFEHPKPQCPETADLIDLCGNPYFHYVGRYLSTLTNFDFNECFRSGRSQREYFQMKDGSKIYKGVMLETNVPLGIESVSLSQAAFMFMTGAGSAMSSSAVGAVTGVTAGAGMAGSMGVLNLVGDGGRQSSVVAFNPYKEYETCTFTVACKSEYVDEDIFGKKVNTDNPTHLYVFADRTLVGDTWLSNKMQPTTYTVPINKCEQLMFWLECGDSRSGQYVLYDMKVDKRKLPPTSNIVRDSKPATAQTVQQAQSNATGAKNNPTKNESDSKKSSAKKDKGSKPRKEKPLVNWVEPSMSGNSSMDTYLKAVNEVWRANQEMQSQAGTSYQIKETYVEASDGTAYKAVTFVDAKGNKQSIAGIMAGNNEFANMEKVVRSKAADADLYVTSASLAVPNMGDKMFEYGKYIRLGSSAVSQCRQQASDLVSIKQMENDVIANMQGRAVVVDGVQSTDKTILLPLSEGETVPEGTVMQQIRYFMMD